MKGKGCCDKAKIGSCRSCVAKHVECHQMHAQKSHRSGLTSHALPHGSATSSDNVHPQLSQKATHTKCKATPLKPRSVPLTWGKSRGTTLQKQCYFPRQEATKINPVTHVLITTQQVPRQVARLSISTEATGCFMSFDSRRKQIYFCLLRSILWVVLF